MPVIIFVMVDVWTLCLLSIFVSFQLYCKLLEGKAVWLIALWISVPIKGAHTMFASIVLQFQEG